MTVRELFDKMDYDLVYVDNIPCEVLEEQDSISLFLPNLDENELIDIDDDAEVEQHPTYPHIWIVSSVNMTLSFWKRVPVIL